MSPLTDTQRWHILGAGAIGSLWAGYAYKAGRPATLIMRDSATLAAYQQAGGFTTQLRSGTEVLPLPATCPEQIIQASTAKASSGGTITALLITTKAQHTLDALKAVAPALTDPPLLVLLQNGMGVAEKVQQLYPRATLLQASTTEGAYRKGPFSVVHAGQGQTLLGQSQSATPTRPQHTLDAASQKQIAQSLSAAPLNVVVSDNIEAVLWRKLAVNSAINPLTVKYRCRNGELLDNPIAAQDMADVVEEILQLSQLLGREDWVEDLLPQVRQVAADTALNRSSMLQDIEAGRTTEIDYITGYLCRLGESQGLSLKRNKALLEIVRRHHPG